MLKERCSEAWSEQQNREKQRTDRQTLRARRLSEDTGIKSTELRLQACTSWCAGQMAESWKRMLATVAQVHSTVPSLWNVHPCESTGDCGGMIKMKEREGVANGGLPLAPPELCWLLCLLIAMLLVLPSLCSKGAPGTSRNDSDGSDKSQTL